MPLRFTPSDTLSGSDDGLFLGYGDRGYPASLPIERHAITIAGSRSGKGAGLIIPNLLRWSHSALVVDPKGENASVTWRARLELGQAVHVIDPFGVADVPPHLRASFNPLAAIDPGALTAREDIRIIADGMVLRPNAKDAEWYDGAVSILAGFIAHAIVRLGPEGATLARVREMLNATGEDWEGILADMADNPACGGLATATAALLQGDAKSSREYLSGARRAIDSFGSEAMQDVLGSSGFSLSDLKNGKTTVFLVLPPDLIDEHARFLRLFVRQALGAMARGGNRTRGRCLFILDEFFSLGRIDAISKAAGLMPSYGVHLWPFLQDYGQLIELYGREGAETFFANADARIFFGNTDYLTLKLVSDWTGQTTPEDIHPYGPPMRPQIPISPDEYLAGQVGPTTPPMQFPVGGKNNAAAVTANIVSGAIHSWLIQDQHRNAAYARNAIAERQRAADVMYENARAAYDYAMRRVGTPRLTPEEVANLTGKGAGDHVARSMIVFGTAGRTYNILLAPYFLPPPTIQVEAPPPELAAPVMRAAPDSMVVYWAAVKKIGVQGTLCAATMAGLAYGYYQTDWGKTPQNWMFPGQDTRLRIWGDSYPVILWFAVALIWAFFRELGKKAQGFMSVPIALAWVSLIAAIVQGISLYRQPGEFLMREPLAAIWFMGDFSSPIYLLATSIAVLVGLTVLALPFVFWDWIRGANKAKG